MHRSTVAAAGRVFDSTAVATAETRDDDADETTSLIVELRVSREAARRRRDSLIGTCFDDAGLEAAIVGEYVDVSKPRSTSSSSMATASNRCNQFDQSLTRPPSLTASRSGRRVISRRKLSSITLQSSSSSSSAYSMIVRSPIRKDVAREDVGEHALFEEHNVVVG